MSLAFESMWRDQPAGSPSLLDLLNSQYKDLETHQEYLKEIIVQQRALFRDWNFMLSLKSRLEEYIGVQKLLEHDGITASSMEQFKKQTLELMSRIKFYETIINQRHTAIDFALDTLDILPHDKIKDE
jgi:hypothetical protein